MAATSDEGIESSAGGEPPLVSEPVAAAPVVAPAASAGSPASTAADAPVEVGLRSSENHRKGLFLGGGIGYGRIQDDITGFGGPTFIASLGYSIVPAIAIVAHIDGLLNVEKDSPTRVAWGVSGGVETHFAGYFRAGLSGGGYNLDLYNSSYWAPGGEVSIGALFTNNPKKNLDSGIDLRAQLAFPDDQATVNLMAFWSFRFLGLFGTGVKKENPTPTPPPTQAAQQPSVQATTAAVPALPGLICVNPECVKASRLTGEWDCDLNGGTKLRFTQHGHFLQSQQGHSGLGCGGCNGKFLMSGDEPESFLFEGTMQVSPSGDRAALQGIWCDHHTSSACGQPGAKRSIGEVACIRTSSEDLPDLPETTSDTSVESSAPSEPISAGEALP